MRTTATVTVRCAAAVVALAVLVSGCSSRKGNDTGATTAATPATSGTSTSVDAVAAAQARVDAAKSGVDDAQNALTKAGETFCGEAGTYVDTLDRYGKLFSDKAATVGDVKTAGADLVEPRESVTAAGSEVDKAKTALVQAQQELIDAQAALTVAKATASGKSAPTTTPATATTTTIVPPATVERVKQAEEDLAQAEKGITDATPLSEATAEYNSAALALQVAWLRLLSEAGCLTDDQEKQAVEFVTTYTTTLQTELKQTGYYTGSVDGIYGPLTVDAVKKLQSESGLPETGFVDKATAAALEAKLAALGQQQAATEMTQTATVQTVLKLTGFWNGPIDGKWTDDLTKALKEFQTKLGVKPTGVVDAATLAAFEKAHGALATAISSATATANSSATASTAAGSTATTTATATTTVTATGAPSSSSPAAPSTGESSSSG